MVNTSPEDGLGEPEEVSSMERFPPLVDVRGWGMRKLLEDHPELKALMNRLVDDVMDPDGALSAFSSFPS